MILRIISEINESFHSKVDLIELADSSYITDESIFLITNNYLKLNIEYFYPEDIEWLNTSFNSLFDLLIKSFSKE